MSAPFDGLLHDVGEPITGNATPSEVDEPRMYDKATTPTHCTGAEVPNPHAMTAPCPRCGQHGVVHIEVRHD